MNDKQQASEQPNQNSSTPEPSHSHPIATGIGAVGGVVTGAAIGRATAGGVGATVGAVAGAIAGAIAGEAIAELTEEVTEDVGKNLGLGANTQEIELPQHYSWDQLRELSKPQATDSTQTS